MENKKVIYIAIIAVGIIILSSILMYFDLKVWNKKKTSDNVQIEESQEQLKKNFDHIFNNKITTNGYDVSKVSKLNDSKEIVYTVYQNDSVENSKYELDVYIPAININSKVADKFNGITQQLFADKTNEILQGPKNYTIYSITYTGYVSGDILSIIIKSTLKEGSTAQRTIVQTYNYNLKTQEEVSIYDAISLKNITQEQLNSKINMEITKSIKEANKIQLTGFETYTRDIKSDIYNIENITTFFIDSDGKLYIIFAYGNNNFTSEMDIIKF